MRRASALILLVFAFGCSPGDFFSVPAGPVPSIALPIVTYYHAYGDSITAGLTLLSPKTQSFPALVAQSTALPTANYGVPGDMACDTPIRIFSASDFPTVKSPGLYSLLISTNDVDTKGPGPYEAVFNLCHQASIAWLALPAEDKTFATSSVVTTSGPNHIDPTDRWNVLFTDASNATITFPLQLASSGPVYVWYLISDNSSGVFTTSLDGNILATTTSGTNPAIATAAGNTQSIALFRLPAIPAGAHTLTFTQTSTGLSGAGILAIGEPPSPVPSTMPRLLIGTTPKQLIGGDSVCSGFPARCLAYSTDISANVALFVADGLNVTLFDTGKYVTATSADMSDDLHPNALGHYEIFHAITDVLP